MLDFFKKDGKIYWAHEITIEELKKEINMQREKIDNLEVNMKFAKDEVIRYQNELADHLATFTNATELLRSLEAKKP